MALVAVMMISCGETNNVTNGNEPDEFVKDSIHEELDSIQISPDAPYYVGKWESKEMRDTSLLPLETIKEIIPIDLSELIDFLGEKGAVAAMPSLKIGATLNENKSAKISVAIKVGIQFYAERNGHTGFFNPSLIPALSSLGSLVDTVLTAPATYEMKDSVLALTVEVVQATGSKTQQTTNFNIKKVSDDHIFVGLTQEMVDAIGESMDFGTGLGQILFDSKGDISTMMQEKELELWKNK